jgi:hypothetical protein
MVLLMKRFGLAVILTTALLSSGVSPCQASEATVQTSVSEAQDQWRSTTAVPGQRLLVHYEGTENIGGADTLRVEAATPFD